MVATVCVCRRLHLDIISLASKVTLISSVPRLWVVLRRSALLVLLLLRLLSIVVGVVLGLTMSVRKSASPPSAVHGLSTPLTSASSVDAAAEEEEDEEGDNDDH